MASVQQHLLRSRQSHRLLNYWNGLHRACVRVTAAPVWNCVNGDICVRNASTAVNRVSAVSNQSSAPYYHVVPAPAKSIKVSAPPSLAGWIPPSTTATTTAVGGSLNTNNGIPYWRAQCEVQWPGATPVASSTSPHSHSEVRFIKLFDDNYCYFIRCGHSGHTTCIDPGDSAPVITALAHWGWQLQTILLTHHHDDHIGGAAQVAASTGAKMYGSKQGIDRLPAGTIGVANGEEIPLGGLTTARVIDTPGHTRDAVSYHVSRIKALFTGDTLFSGGCGRLFEGTPVQMHQSLTKISQLPGDTRVFCGHEYTQSNMKFAMSLPGYSASDIRASRANVINTWRSVGIPTIPSTIDLEMATNPFMFTTHPTRVTQLRDKLEMNTNVEAHEVLAEVRHRKDIF